MRRFGIPVFIFIALFMCAAPMAHAAGIPLLSPDFHIVPSAHDFDSSCPVGAPLSYGGALQLVQNLINAAVGMAVIAFVLIAAYAGASFMINPTNPELRSKAKSMLLNVVVGLAIVLCAWLLIDFIMKIVYNQGSTYGPWNSILAPQTDSWCIKAKAGGSILSGTAGGILSSIAGNNNPTSPTPVAGGGSTGGRCAVRTSGPCSVTNLTPYFGDQATTFSKICTHESGGTSVASGEDIGTDGNPVSFGLLQVNLTDHQIGGYNCPAAFSCSSGKSPCAYTKDNHNVHVTDPRLYAECKAAALDPATNLTYSASLYHSAGFSPWKADNQCIP